MNNNQHLDKLKKKINNFNNKENKNYKRKKSGTGFAFKISTEIIAALAVGVGGCRISLSPRLSRPSPSRRGNEGIIFPHSLARPWRGPMALPRDGSVFFGRVFDIVDTPDRCVNNTASVVVSSTSTGSGNMRAPPLCKKQGEMRHAGV